MANACTASSVVGKCPLLTRYSTTPPTTMGISSIGKMWALPSVNSCMGVPSALILFDQIIVSARRITC